MTDRNPGYYKDRSLSFLPDNVRDYLFKYISLPTMGLICTVIDGDKAYNASFVDTNTDKYIAGSIAVPFDYHSPEQCHQFKYDAVRIPGTDKAVFFADTCEAYKKLYNKE